MEPVLTPPNSPPVCRKCGNQVTPTDFYCPNCGTQLREQQISLGKQLYIYGVSVLLPPLGLIWTFKYFRSTQSNQRMVAIVSLILTVVATVVTIWLFMGFMQTLNQQLNSVLNTNIPGLQ
ncbi:MAG: zinc ribbon domain-containing protein [Patescibacteria group bacterium]|nr:zinc ribbon domain-containing protein [Patescibacteria group bacterium]MDE2590728.1 zinc ribbon domain-containing protein [Patescibacteria group bacterium]